MRWVRKAMAVACAVWLGAFPVAAVGIVDSESGEDWETAVGMSEATWESVTGGDAVAAQAEVPEVGGISAILTDLGSGTVLFEKNADLPVPIASVTKVMTLLLVMEALNDGRLGYDDRPVCSAEAAGYGGSQIWLEPGEAMTVSDLLKAVTVVSANDACAVLAEALSGSVASFVEQMNRRAAELGLTNTHFTDCCGLDDTAYSSARDVAVMSRELMKHEAIQTYTTIWTDTLRDGQSQLVNTNKLVRFYDGATGLKTGTTSAAGHCLSATARRGELGLCAVVLGCQTTNERFGGARKLLDYGFANYTVYTPAWEDAALSPIPVRQGVEETVQPVSDTPEPLLLRRGQEGQVTLEVTVCADLLAPVEADQIVGERTVRLNGEVLATYPVRAAHAVEKVDFWVALYRLWRALVCKM